MSQDRLYKEMLVDLSNRIGIDELESMKFMMKPTDDSNPSIPNRILHQIHTVLGLFEEMSKRDIISPTNVKKLHNLIRACAGNRNQLVEIVKRFEDSNATGNQQATNNRTFTSIGDRSADLKSSHAFEIVTRSIGKNWKDLARTLRLTQVDIEEIELKYPNQLKEQSRACLCAWVDMNYGRVKQEQLVEALRKCKLNMLAHNVEHCSQYRK